MMLMPMALVGAFASASATDTALALASTVALTGPNRLDVDAVVSQCLCDFRIGYELLLCIENQSGAKYLDLIEPVLELTFAMCLLVSLLIDGAMTASTPLNGPTLFSRSISGAVVGLVVLTSGA